MSRRIVALATGRADVYLLGALEPHGVILDTEAMHRPLGAILSDWWPKADMVVILGDTRKALACAFAAHLNQVPIAHIHGGEITEGSLDDSMRHAITKLAHLHFTSCEEHRRRVIQMGEQPGRVFDVGSLGADAATRIAEKAVRDDPPSLVVTLHPEPPGQGSHQEELIKALDRFPYHTILITAANDEPGGSEINARWLEWTQGRENAGLVWDMGQEAYLEACASADAVVGNSSSGVIEVPYLGVPTVNIGDRQKGRRMGSSVLDPFPYRLGIEEAIRKSGRPEFRDRCRRTRPYADGRTAERIARVMRDDPIDGILRKQFYEYRGQVC